MGGEGSFPWAVFLCCGSRYLRYDLDGVETWGPLSFALSAVCENAVRHHGFLKELTIRTDYKKIIIKFRSKEIGIRIEMTCPRSKSNSVAEPQMKAKTSSSCLVPSPDACFFPQEAGFLLDFTAGREVMGVTSSFRFGHSARDILLTVLYKQTRATNQLKLLKTLLTCQYFFKSWLVDTSCALHMSHYARDCWILLKGAQTVKRWKIANR